MKKKILLISHSSGGGGAETVFFEVVKILKTEQIKISLPKGEGILYENLKREKVVVLKNFTIYGNFYKMIFKFFLRDIFYIKDLLKYIKLIKKDKIDIIYSSSITNIQGVLLSLILKKRHIWHIHEINNKNFFWFDKKFNFLYKKYFYNSELIFISKEVAESWIKRLKLNRNKIKYTIVNNPIKIKTIEEKKFLKNKIIIGFLGSNDINKNLKLLINVFKKLLLNYPHLKLILAGKNIKNLKNEFEEIEKKNFELWNYKEAEEFYKEIDIIVIPSFNESWSLTAIEGMYCNIPVVLTKETTLVNYIKTEENVLLFNPKSEIELTEALVKLIENYENYYKKFKKNNKIFFKNQNFNNSFIDKIKNIMVEENIKI